MATIIFEASGTIEGLERELKELSAQNASVIILACDGDGLSKEMIDPVLQKCDAQITGGIFPAIIYDEKKYDSGTILIGLSDRLHINIIEDISLKSAARLDSDIESQIDGFDASVKTMFVFVDGLAKQIGECVEVLFDYHGLDINYIGGGSGSLSLEQRPSLFTNRGLLQDALVYAYSTSPSSIGVTHGWKSVRGPFQVTSVEGTMIKELDFRPAFEVYSEVVGQYVPEGIDTMNFFEIAKAFPFGINTISDERVVRDPIKLEGEAIVCVGSVTEGSYVDILHGKREDLIQAARAAADIAREERTFDEEFTLFIDCVSRVLFLEEDFDDEIDAVQHEGSRLVGALTFGEIANNGRDYLQFYNKTSVVGCIGHG